MNFGCLPTQFARTRGRKLAMLVLGVMLAAGLSACKGGGGGTADTPDTPDPLALAPLPSMANVDVVIATDHTLPDHYGESSAGAEGRERDYIDPAAEVFAEQLRARNLVVHIAKVEARLVSGKIEDKAQFDTAYTSYDALLTAAVNAGSTIVALHFDADRLPPTATLEEASYVGGAQIIVDGRATSEATLALTERLLHQDRLLEQLANDGFRLRPGYETQLRVQDNLTLLIAGESSGGGFLLELAPQQQAREQFGSPANIALALTPALSLLADAIADFRG
ncbi:hypothetical protein L1F30_11550 [Simiduia sp. 21SJ11W-1]|uniref:hypothetical protein n=1 Tax=Simiduia sp. 21SJ11W-1 TaxID=2909669 RepID=UPI00209E438A|nr:hypothetical protein [Simiduia sp. 21SJ11W-1]UTA46794.1 hypothetical protein L1F30_11550 [Simiduia sp. 21SJ11W-1]